MREIPDVLKRWLAFNAVGAIGVAVQLGLLAALVRLGHVHYLAATVIAVEATVLHNFLWHQRWTWKDRPSGSIPAALLRLWHFHLLNGAVSLAGNLGIMAMLAGAIRMDPLAANAIAIVVCSLVNFAASETIVFRARLAGRGESNDGLVGPAALRSAGP